MNTLMGLSHDEYIADRQERDHEFCAAYDEAKVTMRLALALTDLRESRNLSQRALAEKSGIKQPMINRIERGSQAPKPFTLLRLLAALDGILTLRPDGSIYVSPAEHMTADVWLANGRDVLSERAEETTGAQQQPA